MFEENIQLEDLFLRAETSKAYFVENLDGVEAWIPKSLVSRIEFGESYKEFNGNKRMEIVVLEIPEWLVQKKNL